MKVKAKNTKEKIWKFVRFSAEKTFFSCLVAIILAVILGGILFYKYNVLLSKDQSGPGVISIKLQTQNYQKMVDNWQSMQDNFNKADLKNYLNPFIGI